MVPETTTSVRVKITTRVDGLGKLCAARLVDADFITRTEFSGVI